MKTPPGPWTTAMHAEHSVLLSTFWKSRLGMLQQVRESDILLTRRSVLTLAAAGCALAVLPTVVAEDVPPNEFVAADLTDEQSDELTRRHLRSLGWALTAYMEKEGALPPVAVPNDELPPDKRLSGLVLLLPYLRVKPSYFTDEQWIELRKQGVSEPEAKWAKELYQSIDLKKAWDDPANLAATRTVVPVFLLSLGNRHFRDKNGYAVSHLAMVRGWNGLNDGAFTEVAQRNSDIKDGISTTLAIGQIATDLGPWIAAGRSTARYFYPGAKKPSFASRHANLCYFVMCDGTTLLLDVKKTKMQLLLGLVDRADGLGVDGRDLVRYRTLADWKAAQPKKELE